MGTTSSLVKVALAMQLKTNDQSPSASASPVWDTERGLLQCTHGPSLQINNIISLAVVGTSYTCDLGTTTDEKCVYPNEQRKLLIGVKLAIPVWMNGFECETHLG